MNTADMMAGLLLSLLSVALSLGIVMVFLLVRHANRRKSGLTALPHHFPLPPFRDQGFAARPTCWLAIKSRNLRAVQSALALHHVKPCSWTQGIAGEARLFIAPPVAGWVLV